MRQFISWVETPIVVRREACIWWLVLTLIALGMLTLVPWLFRVPVDWLYLDILFSVRNTAIIIGASVGEEFVFRALPLYVFLLFFPRRIAPALVLGGLLSIVFGAWHITLPELQVCIGVAGVVFLIMYLKFGGAFQKPFHGLLACGGAHAMLNFVIACVAKLVVA